MSFSQDLRRPRKDYGISLNNMIILSFLLHALFLSLLLLSPSYPSPKRTSPPSYTVDLVSLPAPAVNTGVAGAVSEKLVDFSVGRFTPVPVLKKHVEPPSVPIQKIVPREKKSNTDGLDKALDKIRSKVERQAQQTSSTVSTSSGDVEINMKMRVYFSMIWSRIKEEWSLPPGILPADNLETVIGLTLMKNGRIAELSYEAKSGNRVFDESVIKAVKKAEPFPPLPEWLREGSVEIGIRFHSSELSSS